MYLVVDGNATIESTNAFNSWEIRSHEESNLAPEVLVRLM
jgi:hypothetical protein